MPVRGAGIAAEAASTTARLLSRCTGVPSTRSSRTHHPLHQLISARACCRLHLELDRLRVLDRPGAARAMATRDRGAQSVCVIVSPRRRAKRVRGLPADAPHVPRKRRMMMPSSMRALCDPEAIWLTRGAHGRRVPGLWERAPCADVQIVKNRLYARKKTAHTVTYTTDARNTRCSRIYAIVRPV